MDRRTHQQSINERTLAAWGEEAQLGMVTEECAELIQALSKWRRKGFNEVPDNLIEELADVEIMLDQLKNICLQHSDDVAARYDAITAEKLKKLEQRLLDWHNKHS